MEGIYYIWMEGRKEKTENRIKGTGNKKDEQNIYMVLTEGRLLEYRMRRKVSSLLAPAF